MKRFKLLVIFMPFFVIGCATTDGLKDESDPFEGFNRTSYAFNSTIDRVALKPLAKGYDAVFPRPIKTGVSNFFSNLDELPTTVNSLLQGKIVDAFGGISRFVINSTLGLAGFIDVASSIGLEKHDEDFGQTLGSWGISPGPYLVLPLFGPTSLRDIAAKPVDGTYSIQGNIDHIATKNTSYFLELIDLRYRLFAIDSQLKDAIDEYTFVRDAYLMRREYQVYDGNPPENEDFYDDFDDEECDSVSVEDCSSEEILD